MKQTTDLQMKLHPHAECVQQDGHENAALEAVPLHNDRHLLLHQSNDPCGQKNINRSPSPVTQDFFHH